MNRHEPYHGSCWDEALPARLDVVVRNWSTAVAKREPWASMRLDDVTGELRALTAALLNAACDNGDARRRRIVRAASAHGQFRRAQRFPKRLLTAELAALREAIRLDLQSGYWSEALVEQAVDGLVADLRLARQLAERAFLRKPDATAPVPEVQHQP
jgi:hypothetical protein